MNKIYNINLFVNIIYMAQPTKPNPDFFVHLGPDVSMNNLDVNTIWFEDGTYLNSAKGLVGTAGGLSFQYNVNINNQNDPGNDNDEMI